MFLHLMFILHSRLHLSAQKISALAALQALGGTKGQAMNYVNGLKAGGSATYCYPGEKSKLPSWTEDDMKRELSARQVVDWSKQDHKLTVRFTTVVGYNHKLVCLPNQHYIMN